MDDTPVPPLTMGRIPVTSDDKLTAEKTGAPLVMPCNTVPVDPTAMLPADLLLVAYKTLFVVNPANDPEALLVIVIVFVLEFPVKSIPEPAAKLMVSLFEFAAIVVEPMVKFLKISCADPVSELVMVVPEIEMPDPAVNETFPVAPPTDNTPALLICKPFRLIPEPLVRLTAPVCPCNEVTETGIVAEIFGFCLLPLIVIFVPESTE